MKKLLNKKDIEDIKKNLILNQDFRRELCSVSHKWFFATYFSDYIKYPSPEFHSELFEITEDSDEFLSVIVAFRGSAKSTIMSLSNPIWSMIGAPGKKHIVLISRTKELASKILQNIRRELESNTLLIQDFGPFTTVLDTWNSKEIYIKKYETVITSLSITSNKRGLREGSNRPDLIICDDIQDVDSTRTKEGRDKVYEWYVNEIVPLGDLNTKIIIIGNLLHEDSLVSRLKEDIFTGKKSGVYREFPLMNEVGVSLWPSKYSLVEIDKLKKKIGDDRAFEVEYMLRILPRNGQVIYRDWITYYTDLPLARPDRIFSGVDLAVSQKTSSDYTAIVTVYVYGEYDNWKAFVLPNSLNRKLLFPEVKTAIIGTALSHSFCDHIVAIESNGYQGIMVQELESKGITCKSYNSTSDKFVRLHNTSASIKNGLLLFPKKGAEDLISQIVGLGVEKHDDLADAFSLAVIAMLGVMNEPPPKIFFI